MAKKKQETNSAAEVKAAEVKAAEVEAAEAPAPENYVAY